MVPRLIALIALISAEPIAAQVALATADEYTRYELLAPASAQFKIRYDVTVVTAGARVFFNPIRRGSEASDESVIDPRTGQPLPFRVVDGQAARREGLVNADPAGAYLRVELPRPVPANGETRLRIIKTYRDPKSYRTEGREIVFDRSLSILRNAVVLPAGYELVGVNYPSQVLTEPDGRITISFWNVGTAPVPLVVRGRALP